MHENDHFIHHHARNIYQAVLNLFLERREIGGRANHSNQSLGSMNYSMGSISSAANTFEYSSGGKSEGWGRFFGRSLDWCEPDAQGVQNGPFGMNHSLFRQEYIISQNTLYELIMETFIPPKIMFDSEENNNEKTEKNTVTPSPHPCWPPPLPQSLCLPLLQISCHA